MTIVITYLAKDNAKNRKYKKTGEFFAKKDADRAMAKKIAKAWAKLTHVDLPKQHENYSGPICLPEVAIFRAGHRKSNSVTAR
ncbi:hypothetical protein PMPD1_3122 [Paramixta manurensis]|uniref:Uncharacterized protein n=1 Tax=Paramixta manurensis TaxID=2740817 RepID=A0A6M8UEP5_9GAMM|nr:hypothetical protein PMPD1_3122 [Erwiniaceae bacterium PD-1]